MWILLCFKHQGVRGKQRGVSRLTEGENVQNGLRLNSNTQLGLYVERTLQTAHVKVDLHAKNVPAAFLSSKMLGEKCLTLRFSGGAKRRPLQPVVELSALRGGCAQAGVGTARTTWRGQRGRGYGGCASLRWPVDGRAPWD